MELEVNKVPGLVVGSVYRIQATNESRFITRLKQIVRGIKRHKDIIIGTNQNIDYLKLNTNKYSYLLFKR